MKLHVCHALVCLSGQLNGMIVSVSQGNYSESKPSLHCHSHSVIDYWREMVSISSCLYSGVGLEICNLVFHFINSWWLDM